MNPCLQTSWTGSVLRDKCHFFPLTHRCCFLKILVWQVALSQSVGAASTHFMPRLTPWNKGNSDSRNPVAVDENGKQHCTGLRSYCLMQDQNLLPCSYSTNNIKKPMNHESSSTNLNYWPMEAIQLSFPTGKPLGSSIPSSWANAEFLQPGRNWTPPNEWGNLPPNLGR